MKKRLFGCILLTAVLMAGSIAGLDVVYAGEPAEKNTEDREVSKEPGKTFLDMIMEEPEEGSWEDVEELTPGVLGDGIFKLNVELKDASGDGRIQSPTTMNISGGAAKVLIAWDTDRYEYLRLNGTEYFPLKKEETSVFEVKLDVLNQDMKIEVGGTKDTDVPWSDTYVIAFDLDSIEKDGMNPRTFGMIFGVIVGIVVMFVIIKLDKIHDKRKDAAQKSPAVKNTNKYRK